MKFRKKPVVIEATQWFKQGDHPAVIIKSNPDNYADMGVPWIDTLEGGHVVSVGDWIITGVKGEHYPCKDEIFRMTYEPVGEQKND
jgi:predicted P-loop ATPase/GTPase